jgi:Kef-type K+ transport system membrane component KefB
LAGATAGCVALVAGQLELPIQGRELLLLSAGVGLASAQSVRDAVISVADRDGARGPMTSWLMDFSRADDAPVLLSLPFLFAFFHPQQTLAGRDLGPVFMASLSLVCGGFFGLTAAWLLAHASSRAERWTILLGAGLLATGSSGSIGLSAMGTCFALGVTLSLRVKDTEQIREKLAATEGPVLLPALLLAGAHLAAPRVVGEWWMLALATAVRIAVTVVTGGLIGAATRRQRAVVPFFALGLLSSGTLSMIVGLGLVLRFDGDAGRATLATAFIGTVLGELIGAPALRRALLLSGEITPTAAPEGGNDGPTPAELAA